MMKKVFKQVLGADVAQKELVVTLGRVYDDFSVELYAHKVFRNMDKGIIALLDWVKKMTDPEVALHFVVKATGVYHQKFAFYLDEHGYQLSFVLPNKISNYIRILENKTITDKTCSQAIARFGLERKLDRWEKPKKVYRLLQQLTRERDQIVIEWVVIKNQLHEEQAEAEPNGKAWNGLKKDAPFEQAGEGD